jgi:hypothetical protein
VGVAVDGYYDGSIYEVYNGLPADDHPVDNVVVEVMDYNEANPTAFQNIPPPPNQVRFLRTCTSRKHYTFHYTSETKHFFTLFIY